MMDKGKNQFKLLKYRMKVGDPDTLLVQGIFTENEIQDHRLAFLFEGQELPVSYSTKEGVAVRNKHLADPYYIDREYYFWVSLPAKMENEQILRVMDIYSGKECLVCEISCGELLGRRMQIDHIIDSIEMQDRKLLITGWLVADSTLIKISVLDQKEQPVDFEMKKIYRQDVVMEYPETTDEQNPAEVCGFRLEFDRPGGKSAALLFQEGEKCVTEQCQLQSSSKIKHMTQKAQNIYRKAAAYRRANGTKEMLRKGTMKILEKAGLLNLYDVWWSKNKPSPDELKQQRQTRFPYEPKISIVVPLYRTPLPFLRGLIDSVLKQTYTNWELCLSDGSGAPDSALSRKVNQYVQEDSRIHFVSNRETLQISENTNRAIAVATGEYIAFADHDDLFAPDALYECVKALNNDSEIDILYSDEDKISMNGKEHFGPHFKTDFNIDLLCSMNYICHLFVVRNTILKETGGLRSEYDGAQDHDLILRCVELTDKIYHIPKILYHWRSHKDSTAQKPENKQYAFDAGVKAVQAHYDRVGISAKVQKGEYPGLYRTEHIFKEQPLISIIIPNKDHIDDLKQCISSIENNRYQNYEYIIVENNSEKEETFSFYRQLEKENPKAKVVYWKEGFNFSAINNYGASFAKGTYLLLLNNDTKMIYENCLEELLGYCTHDSVGAVGARLYYDDDTIQHAGVIIGFNGIAGHAFIGQPRSANGYCSRIICAQDMSAVTAACMMVKKSVFDAVGGLDESLAVAFNDIDLCMKIRRAGYLIVYNPYAELYHYESKSRGLEDTKEKVERFQKEIAVFAGKWSDVLKAGDPYYNPNLSIERADFSPK